MPDFETPPPAPSSSEGAPARPVPPVAPHSSPSVEYVPGLRRQYYENRRRATPSRGDPQTSAEPVTYNPQRVRISSQDRQRMKAVERKQFVATLKGRRGTFGRWVASLLEAWERLRKPKAKTPRGGKPNRRGERIASNSRDGAAPSNAPAKKRRRRRGGSGGGAKKQSQSGPNDLQQKKSNGGNARPPRKQAQHGGGGGNPSGAPAKKSGRRRNRGRRGQGGGGNTKPASD